MRTYPIDDPVFQARVRRSVSRALGRGRLGSLADRVQADVRDDYPSCRIRLQESLASTSDELIVYAYREGTVPRSTGRSTGTDAETPVEAGAPG